MAVVPRPLSISVDVPTCFYCGGAEIYDHHRHNGMDAVCDSSWLGRSVGEECMFFYLDWDECGGGGVPGEDQMLAEIY